MVGWMLSICLALGVVTAHFYFSIYPFLWLPIYTIMKTQPKLTFGSLTHQLCLPLITSTLPFWWEFPEITVVETSHVWLVSWTPCWAIPHYCLMQPWQQKLPKVSLRMVCAQCKFNSCIQSQRYEWPSLWSCSSSLKRWWPSCTAWTLFKCRCLEMPSAYDPSFLGGWT